MYGPQDRRNYESDYLNVANFVSRRCSRILWLMVSNAAVRCSRDNKASLPLAIALLF